MSDVYFVRQVGEVGPVKIGFTTFIRERIAQLSLWAPKPLEVLATVPGGRDLEARFHAEFRHDRCHGEWFNWSQRLQDTIDAINAGEFNCIALAFPVARRASRPRVRDNRPKGWTYDGSLLSDALSFCVRNGISESGFGRLTVKDPALLLQMRQGRRPGATITNRLRSFMATYHPTTDQQAEAA